MDWGLLDKNAGENLFLREQIVYDYKVGDYYITLEEHCRVFYFWNAKHYCNVQESRGSLTVNWWNVLLA